MPVGMEGGFTLESAWFHESGHVRTQLLHAPARQRVRAMRGLGCMLTSIRHALVVLTSLASTAAASAASAACARFHCQRRGLVHGARMDRDTCFAARIFMGNCEGQRGHAALQSVGVGEKSISLARILPRIYAAILFEH